MYLCARCLSKRASPTVKRNEARIHTTPSYGEGQRTIDDISHSRSTHSRYTPSIAQRRLCSATIRRPPTMKHRPAVLVCARAHTHTNTYALEKGQPPASAASMSIVTIRDRYTPSTSSVGRGEQPHADAYTILLSFSLSLCDYFLCFFFKLLVHLKLAFGIFGSQLSNEYM